MKQLFLFSLLLSSFVSFSQTHYSADTVKPPANYDNIYIKTLATDSLSSNFVIFIKKEVKKHKHEFHTENVCVLEGEGEMILGDKKILVKKGDVIFIPKNTIHSLKVTSKIPMKVISIQSPYFDGKDRILID